MKKTTIYKCEGCDFTGSAKDVRAHEKTCSKIVAKQTKESGIQKQIEHERKNIRLIAKSISHLEHLLNEHSKLLGENEKITLSMDFDECVCHSHSAPIEKSLRIWDIKDPTAPKGYPGFRGNVKFTKPSKTGKYAGEYFTGGRYNGMCVDGFHTGTGGGAYESSYDCEIFIDDFPLIKEKVEAVLALSKVSDAFDKNERKKRSEIHALVIRKTATDSVSINIKNTVDDCISKKKQLDEQLDELNEAGIKRISDLQLLVIDENPDLCAVKNYHQSEVDALWSKIQKEI